MTQNDTTAEKDLAVLCIFKRRRVFRANVEERKPYTLGRGSADGAAPSRRREL